MLRAVCLLHAAHTADGYLAAGRSQELQASQGGTRTDGPATSAPGSAGMPANAANRAAAAWVEAWGPPP